MRGVSRFWSCDGALMRCFFFALNRSHGCPERRENENPDHEGEGGEIYAKEAVGTTPE